MNDIICRGRWSEMVKDRADTLYACWVKFLFDKYSGIRLFMNGYDSAYDEALRAVVHMQRATSEFIKVGPMLITPDVWPISEDGVIGAELTLALKSRQKGKGYRVTDVRIEGNTITIVTDTISYSYTYMWNLEETYTRFLKLYRKRELMKDDSPLVMEMSLDESRSA